MDATFYTIGHSTRSLLEFVALLRIAQVELVADVRSVPRSRTNPQFNLDVLPPALEEYQIAYEHMPTLGGLRPRSGDIPGSVNDFWKNESFHNYADYAMSEKFRHGIDHLRRLGHQRRTAIMCAEAVWWRCHRRIIADYLIAAGEMVFHILSPTSIPIATLTPAAKLQADGTITYPAEAA